MLSRLFTALSKNFPKQVKQASKNIGILETHRQSRLKELKNGIIETEGEIKRYNESVRGLSIFTRATLGHEKWGQLIKREELIDEYNKLGDHDINRIQPKR